MLRFSSLDDAWTHYLSRLVNIPAGDSRDGDARELIGASFVLTDPSCCWLINARRNMSPYYAAAEILWYASGAADVSMVSRYALQYKRFAEENGEAYGAYGKRLGSQIEVAVNILRDQPNSRRVVLSLWDKVDLSAGHGPNAVKDVPCTLNWQFLVRGSQLHMVVNMRSNDIWLGTPYDVFWNCTAMKLVANELGLGLGTYTHHVGSLHLYERHYEAAREALDVKHEDSPAVWALSDEDDTFAALQDAVESERELRLTGAIRGHAYDSVISHSLSCLCQNYLMRDVEGHVRAVPGDYTISELETRFLRLKQEQKGD